MAELVVAVLLAAVVLGQVLDKPLLLGYVRTGSMEPVLQPGDGFISLPPPLATPSVGDVIVYRAEQLNGGGLTTHRIVSETTRGYITRGDANPFTDQATGEPPVRRQQVVAVAVALNGQVLAIPGLGVISQGTQRVLGAVVGGVPRHLLIGGAVAGVTLLLLDDAASGRRDRTPVADRTTGRHRDRTSGRSDRDIVLACGFLLVAVATMSMLVPLGPTEYRIVSAQSDVPGPQVIPAGATETTTYRVPGGTVVPTWYHVEPASDGVTVTNASGVVAVGTTANVTVTLSAPPALGSYRRYVSEHRYPLVLPLSVIRALASVHPLAPVAGVNAVILIPTLLTARLVSARSRRRRPPTTPTMRERLFGRRDK